MQKETTPKASCNVNDNASEDKKNKVTTPKSSATEEQIESEIDRINPDETSMESRG